MNYSTLFNTIQGFVENDFPSTTVNASSGSGTSTFTSKEQIDTFIKEAEQRIYNSVQILALRKNVTGQVTTNNPYLATPSDWLANFSLAVINPVTGGYEYLLNKDVNYIREAFPFPAVTGKPTHYSYFDENTYLIGPTPNADYVMELHYFFYPPSIVTAGDSWLGEYFDSVLLYGSLLEAYTFMKGEKDVIDNYIARYNEALMLLKQLSEGKNRQDMYRTQQIRVPVR
jgi:hypothetical protein